MKRMLQMTAVSLFALGTVTAPALAASSETSASGNLRTETQRQDDTAVDRAVDATEDAVQATTDAARDAARDVKEGAESMASQNGEEASSLSTGQMLASDLLGKAVVTDGDEQVGEVSDLVLSREGGLESIIVGVGGFLGLGEKRVALSPGEYQVRTDANGEATIVTSLNEEQLRAEPEFRVMSEASAQ